MSRTSLHISTNSTIRLEEPEHYTVKEGRIVVTDMEKNTNPYGPGDEFDVPAKGGVSIYCLEQAIAYATEAS